MNELPRRENVILRILMNIRNLTIGERVRGFSDEIGAG